jgi:hypothetical protein
VNCANLQKYADFVRRLQLEIGYTMAEIAALNEA